MALIILSMGTASPAFWLLIVAALLPALVLVLASLNK